MGRRTISPLVALGLAFSLAACGGSDTDDARSSTERTESPTTAATATPGPTAAPTPTAPVVRSSELDVTGRTVRFGNVDFSVARAELSTADPASRAAGLDLPSTSTFLYLDVAVVNEFERAALTVNARDFLALRIGDMEIGAELQSNDISPGSVIRPGTTGTYHVFYEVPPGFDVNDAALVFGGRARQPLVLPLGPDAAAPLSLYPRAVPAVVDATVDGGSACGPSQLRARTEVALVALDLPADLSDTGRLPQRAAAGEVFVEIVSRFEVVAAGDGSGGGCVGTVVTDDLVRLAVDGVTESERYVEGDSEVEAQVGDVVSITVGFMVPVDAQLTLGLGNSAGATASVAFSAGP